MFKHANDYDSNNELGNLGQGDNPEAYIKRLKKCVNV